MDTRGRSRDVSPVALARRRVMASLEPDVHTRIPISVAAQSNQYKQPLSQHDQHRSPPPLNTRTQPQQLDSRHSTMYASQQPVPSSSRLAPLLSHLSYAYRSPSTSSSNTASPSISPNDAFLLRTDSSSTLSCSPEATLTPPECPFTDRHLSISLDYYDSPPSPPRTLQDQMQVAYALDNMHLAKVLLLKLRGIEVTDDNDPRIEQVKDEDFSSSFVPEGGLRLEEKDEQRCREGQRRERERIRRREREERLRVCERIWEFSSICMREEKAKVARRKEEQARERRKLSIEARSREREARERGVEKDSDIMAKYTRQLKMSTCANKRAVLSYDSLPASPSRAPVSPTIPRNQSSGFQYELMRPVHTTRLSPPSPKSPLSSPHRAIRELSAISSRSVPFASVVASMRGPLFPTREEEESGCSKLRHSRTPTQLQLLDDMFKEEIWEDPEHRPAATGTGRPAVAGRRRTEECAAISSSPECTAIPSTSASASTLSSSATTITTRSNSWFSFGNRSSTLSSISTLLTTPSSSIKSAGSSVIPPASSTATIEPQSRSVIVHTQRSRYVSRRSLIQQPSEDPLGILPSLTEPSSTNTNNTQLSRGRPLTRTSTIISTPLNDTIIPSSSTAAETEGLVRRMSRSVSVFIDMAAQFQRAYVKATMFTTGSDLYTSLSRSNSRSRSGSRGSSGSCERRGRQRGGRWSSVSPVAIADRRRVFSGLERGRKVTRERSMKSREEGYRACPSDVSIFLSPVSLLSSLESELDQSSSSDVNDLQPSCAHPLIPLLPPSSSSTTTHARKLPLPPPIPRSPFRLPYPPLTLTSRLRPIANPLLLRLKALQNVVSDRKRGMVDVMGGIRETREKVLGVAWEGIGRSGLGWEVTVC